MSFLGGAPTSTCGFVCSFVNKIQNVGLNVCQFHTGVLAPPQGLNVCQFYTGVLGPAQMSVPPLEQTHRCAPPTLHGRGLCLPFGFYFFQSKLLKLSNYVYKQTNTLV